PCTRGVRGSNPLQSIFKNTIKI
ncbi:uncharacterized protein METZ01_LOCUS408831, partial [marine metagenome]